jgi:hypothetical protein
MRFVMTRFLNNLLTVAVISTATLAPVLVLGLATTIVR